MRARDVLSYELNILVPDISFGMEPPFSATLESMITDYWTVDKWKVIALRLYI